MLDAKLVAQRASALGAGAAQAPVAAGIAVRQAPPAARYSLRLEASVAEEIGEVAGFRLGLPINRLAVSGERMAARLGPDEWLLLGPAEDAEVISKQIEAALAGRFHALVDIGHRHFAAEVSGVHAADVLNAGCPLDLADAAFPAGSATRTLLGKAEIVLLRLEGETHYRVECWRSFAMYVNSFLVEAAREFGPSAT